MRNPPGMISDKEHNLYGTTEQGGSASFAGLVYELKHTTSGWKESVIYNFTGGDDGCWPEFGSVTIPKSGKIYGTTGAGGADNQGVIYRLKKSNGTWSETTLYAFTGGDDAGQVFAGVTLDPFGNVFGASAYDGSGSYGAVVKLAKQKSGWQEKTLLDFTGSNGGYAYGNIMIGSDNNLYGTTFRGGNLSCDTVQQGCGVVFEMTP
jgi:uncharacterized repeat protein (TIGR03803 family)